MSNYSLVGGRGSLDLGLRIADYEFNEIQIRKSKIQNGGGLNLIKGSPFFTLKIGMKNILK